MNLIQNQWQKRLSSKTRPITRPRIWIAGWWLKQSFPKLGIQKSGQKGEEVEDLVINNHLVLINQPSDPPSFYFRANNKLLFVFPFPTYCKKIAPTKDIFSTSEKHIVFICGISLGRKFWVRNGNVPLCLPNITICQDSKYNVQCNYVTCWCFDVRKLTCMCLVHVDLPPVRTVEYSSIV